MLARVICRQFRAHPRQAARLLRRALAEARAFARSAMVHPGNREGYALLLRGRTRDALGQIRRASAMHRFAGRDTLEPIRRIVQEGDYQQASSRLQAWLNDAIPGRIHPDRRAEAHNLLGICLRHIERAKEALPHHLRAARIAEDRPLQLDSMIEYALALRETGQHRQALRIVERTVEQSGDHLKILARALRVQGVFLKDQGRFSEALTAVRRSRQVGLHHMTLSEEADILGRLGRYEEALQAQTIAARIIMEKGHDLVTSPTLRHCTVRQAQMNALLGRDRVAENILRRAIQQVQQAHRSEEPKRRAHLYFYADLIAFFRARGCAEAAEVAFGEAIERGLREDRLERTILSKLTFWQPPSP